MIRHARAEESRPGVPDAARALTADGSARFQRSARGLARILDAPAILLTSPLLRARQTAALCSAAWGGMAVTPEPALASGSADAILGALRGQPDELSVALVGHEPTLSLLVTELMGAEGETIAFGVGTAALLDLTAVARCSGRLVWFLPAAVTEALGAP